MYDIYVCLIAQRDGDGHTYYAVLNALCSLRAMRARSCALRRPHTLCSAQRLPDLRAMRALSCAMLRVLSC